MADYLDMTQAFELVSHRRLKSKMKSYGITDPIHSRSTSYLLSRNQVATVNGFTSHTRPANSGVIQSNVPGPLPFLLCVDDVFNVFRNGVRFLFADGIQILYTFQHGALGSTVAKATQGLISISTWANKWRIKFSAKNNYFHVLQAHLIHRAALNC